LHNFKKSSNFCPYCAIPSKILCNNNECKICHERSFTSHSKSNFWSKTNKVNPRHVLKSSHNKYLFDCTDCKHEFEKPLNIVVKDSWCPYCNSSKKLCDNDCNLCFNKSFASHTKSKNLSTKNNIDPRKIFLNSNSKYLFNCDDCNHEFEQALNCVVSGIWCPYCNSHKLCNNGLQHVL